MDHLPVPMLVRRGQQSAAPQHQSW
jgi:hypothetical protein